MLNKKILLELCLIAQNRDPEEVIRNAYYMYIDSMSF